MPRRLAPAPIPRPPPRLAVGQPDARAERADILVCRLHQLAAGRIDGAGQMAGRVFGRVADVEHIERAGDVVAEARQPLAVDLHDAEFLADAFGRGLGPAEAL